MSYSTFPTDYHDRTADESQPAAAPNPVLAHIRAYQAKQIDRRVPAHASIEDQKLWVGKHLKHYELTLDDLQPGFWDEPEEKRRELLRHLRRYGKRAHRMAERGYPKNYYELPADEQRRTGNAVRQRRLRAKKPARSSAPKPAHAIPADPVTSTYWARDRLALLKTWTAGADPRARQLRDRETEFVKAAARYQSLRSTLGRQPSLGEFAGKMGCQRWKAQNLVRVLENLYRGAWKRDGV